MYCSATSTLARTPAVVTVPPGTRTSSSARAVLLMGLSGELRVEDLARHRYEVRVGHPRAVEPVAGLAQLVLAHLGERALVHLGVAPARDERRHAAHRVRAAAVAGAHEELGVRAHERHRHGDLRAVGEHVVLPRAQLLDDREDVVPPPGVEAGRVLAQLVED